MTKLHVFVWVLFLFLFLDQRPTGGIVPIPVASRILESWCVFYKEVDGEGKTKDQIQLQLLPDVARCTPLDFYKIYSVQTERYERSDLVSALLPDVARCILLGSQQALHSQVQAFYRHQIHVILKDHLNLQHSADDV